MLSQTKINVPCVGGGLDKEAKRRDDSRKRDLHCELVKDNVLLLKTKRANFIVEINYKVIRLCETFNSLDRVYNINRCHRIC